MREFRAQFLLATTLLLLLIISVPAFAKGKLVHQNELLTEAREKGNVRLIVTFSVPDLEKRKQMSRFIKVKQPDVSRSSSEIAGLKKADDDLAGAIRTSAISLFTGLGLEKNIEYIFKTVSQAVINADFQDLLILADSPQVIRVVEDEAIPLPETESPGDALNDRALGSYGVDIVNAPQAWAKGYDGRGWYVAVLDTGVRTSHEMFAGKNIAEACFSTTWAGFSTSLCPGGSAEATGPGSAVPPDEFGHGTHVSGIAVGSQAGGDMKGVAPGANLIAVQVFSYIEDWYDVGSFFSDQIKGLEYVYALRVNHSIAAVNLSLGSGCYSDYCDYDPRKPAIDNLRAAGIAVTVANGNDGYCEALNSPACVSSAIAAGASDSNDQAYWFNDWHPVMQDIFAPGVAILSASSWSDTGYSIKTGTSMAAPHVAGAWAIFRQSAPTYTVSEIEDAMKKSGVPVDSGCDTEPSSGPRLNVDATLDYLLASFDIPTLSEWRLIVFALLMAAIAIISIRKGDLDNKH